MHMSKRLACALTVLVASLLFLYRDVLFWLMNDWELDGNYSHGWLVVPIALYLVWERRDRLRAAQRRPSAWGLVALLGCLAMLAAGTIAAETFSARLSLVGTIVAGIWFVAGREHVRILWFPLVFLLLMIPIPQIIFNRITFPLQLVASTFGERALSLLGIPVLREGNLIMLENVSLDVAEACSGIRSLISLFTLSVLYGYFTRTSPVVRVVLLLATVPIAIAANGCRVAATGIAAHFFGSQAAEGFSHLAAGWVLFLIAGGAVITVKLLADLCVRRFTIGAPTLPASAKGCA
jgi:exosortase